MNTNELEVALNPEEELRRLREKSDRDELVEMKRGLFGSYRSRDVAQYVDRLKDQLQTAERTFKGRITELEAERDKVKAENATLSQNLAQAAKTQEKPASAPAAPVKDESAGEGMLALQREVDELREQLRQAREQKESVLSGKDGLQSELDGLRARLDAEIAEHDRLIAESNRENKALNDRIEALVRANGSLADQLEVSKGNILEAIAEKDSFADENAQLRQTLNILIVKAEAAVDENEALNARLDAEREQTQRYRALYESISDCLARVRAAARIVEERVAETDKTLSWGAGQASKPATGEHKRTKAELLDFNEGKGPAVRELIGELKSIQGELAQ